MKNKKSTVSNLTLAKKIHITFQEKMVLLTTTLFGSKELKHTQSVLLQE